MIDLEPYFLTADDLFTDDELLSIKEFYDNCDLSTPCDKSDYPDLWGLWSNDDL